MSTNHEIFTKEDCEKKLGELMELVEDIEQQWELKTTKGIPDQYWVLNDIYKKEGA
ncbi:hypothetical protein SAMN04487943_104333 [Gracilibacillus orientalis]|uniref:Uncharacterized protein n=1 Tax=Gracilibacillus orientalis TaxID=334253 RepID=A0A1I4L3S7_9BACI|nr:hypothetical protein [Gracilibacillus orientalis]SFL85698.1 hypothetical protein SAMN04487943_104333 [Gracilibacillus orientalis]